MRLRLVMAVMAVSLVFVTPVDAQTQLDRAREDIEQATENLEEYLADLEETQRRGDELAGRYWQVQSGLEKLDLDIDVTERATAVLQLQRGGLRSQVRSIALDQYVSRSEGVGIIDHISEADRAAAETLARLVVGMDNEAIDQLAVVDAEYERTRETLQSQREAQVQALSEVEATQTALVEELERLFHFFDALDSELTELENALIELEDAEAERQAAAEAERVRIADERRRAEEAAAAAAALTRSVPTPAPPIPQLPDQVSTVVPNPRLPDQVATVVPNPQLPDQVGTAVPNPQLPDQVATVVPNPRLPDQVATVVPNPRLPDQVGTAVPNPQLPDQVGTVVPNPRLPDQVGTVVPNPRLPDQVGTAVPNPQLPDQVATAVPNPQLPDQVGTAVPNPQPSAPVVPSGGGMVCPLAGPFTHTDDFNSPRAVGGVHRANDLISPHGTPVLAVVSGMIEHRNSSVGGMSAHLKGDNGDYYFYTHLSGYENVDAGHVAAGAVIGYVGMTGNAPIPHLHFEIHSGGYGNYTNPYGPVRTACF